MAQTNTNAAGGQGRITVFSMFGPVFAYISRWEKDQQRQVAYVGPVTPDVHWRQLWAMADRCHNARDSEESKARWIVRQAHRSLICGSDLVVRLSDEKWEMEAGGWQADMGGDWCNQNRLVTGSIHVPSLTAEQTGRQFTYWPQYAT